MKKVRLLLLLFILLWLDAGCQLINKTQFVFEGIEEKIGTQGPIFLKMKQPSLFDPLNIEITISPHVELNLTYQKDLLEIRPTTYFLPDQEYSLTLAVKDTHTPSTQKKTQYFWKFKTNPACLLYLAPAAQSADIWQYCLDDQIKTRLSHTDGQVLAFNPSPDGKWIVYSSRNELGGSDIWLMDRQGKKSRMLIQCGRDSCADVKFTSDEKNIVFIKHVLNPVANNNQWINEIHLMDIAEQKTYTFRIDEKLNPILMDMNNGNKKISFFDHRSSSIWIYDFKTQTTVKLPSSEGLGGSWNKANGFFTFARMKYWGGIPYGEVYQYDPSSNTIVSFLDGREFLYEFFIPQWRPQDDWLAVAVRPIDGSASRQIILVSKDKKQSINVTFDQTNSYGLFSWSFDGEMIAYQRLQLGVSNASPQIGLWRMKDRSHFILEENAAAPQWIP